MFKRVFGGCITVAQYTCTSFVEPTKRKLQTCYVYNNLRYDIYIYINIWDISLGRPSQLISTALILPQPGATAAGHSKSWLCWSSNLRRLGGVTQMMQMTAALKQAVVGHVYEWKATKARKTCHVFWHMKTCPIFIHAVFVCFCGCFWSMRGSSKCSGRYLRGAKDRVIIFIERGNR